MILGAGAFIAGSMWEITASLADIEKSSTDAVAMICIIVGIVAGIVGFVLLGVSGV